MRKVILGLAVSLDGFIEGPNGEYDWCFTDQDYGMSDFLKRIDSIFVGRKTYEMFMKSGDDSQPDDGPFAKIKNYVFSNTLKNVTDKFHLVSGDVRKQVNELKQQEGKDIWLFGGASLTTSFMNEKLVDEIWLGVHPVLLGGGKPLFQGIKERIHLALIEEKSYPNGLVSLIYTLSDQKPKRKKKK